MINLLLVNSILINSFINSGIFCKEYTMKKLTAEIIAHHVTTKDKISINKYKSHMILMNKLNNDADMICV